MRYRMEVKIEGESMTITEGLCCSCRVRSNTLRLVWRARYLEEEVQCGMCVTEVVTMEHLVSMIPCGVSWIPNKKYCSSYLCFYYEIDNMELVDNKELIF